MWENPFKWIRRSFSRASTNQDSRVQEIEQLHEFLQAYTSSSVRTNPLREFDEQYFKLPTEQIIAKLPALYLSYEQHISEYKQRKSTEIALRKAVQLRFPKLVELPQFHLIFQEEGEQHILLAKIFLQGLLKGVIQILGKMEDHFFENALNWVNDLPAVQQAFPTFEEKEVGVEKIDAHYLSLISQSIGSKLTQNMGARFTQMSFDRTYQDIASLYKLLDTFPIIISLIPQQFLDTEKIGLLSKHQISNALLEKVNFLEELNQQLAKRNQQLQKAQAQVRKAQKASEEAYLQLREVMNAVGDGIITANDKSEIIMINKKVEEVWGYSADELIGQKLSILMPEKYRQRHQQGMNRYIRTRESRILNQNIIMEGMRKNGDLFPLEINISDLQFQGRHLFTAAVRDITPRIKVENDLKSSKDQLEQKTKDLEQAQGQLKITIKELKNSNHDLERFAYVASHDLQEPLRTVKGYLALIPDKIVDLENKEVKEYLSFANLGVVRMEQLIQGLLKYARIGREAAELAQVPFDDIMTLVNYNLREQINLAGAVIQYESGPKLLGNKIQLIQLFQNLLSNSIKFAKKNETPSILISHKKVADTWHFSIEDNGIGIPAERQTAIFEVFRRAHSYQEIEGAGIGLAICKKVVEQHGGNITVKSIPGVGTEFLFTLSDLETEVKGSTIRY